MNCPICQNSSTLVKTIKHINMHQCSDCKCIFTLQDISDICENVRTGTSGRNEEEVNKWRIEQIEKIEPEVKNILDFGCGNGIFVDFANKLGYNCIGVDVDTELSLPKIPDNSIDCIFMVEVIEHIINPFPIVEEFRRILTKNGVIYVESSFSDFLEIENGYIDPKIGHCLIHSEKSLLKVFGEKVTKINRNVYIFGGK